MSESKRFRVAFPVVTLPPHLGGKRALVMISFARKDEPNIHFSNCIDIDGNIHQAVPMSVNTLRAATLNPVHFLEVEKMDAPNAGLILPGAP